MNQPMNAGGYIPSWDESKPVGYYPGEDDTDNARCECGRFIPCRHCPTPIDPADIRPGDVVRLLDHRGTEVEFKVGGRGTRYQIILHLAGQEIRFLPSDGTWRLVHRPDPDAEAVEALASLFGDEFPDVARETGTKALVLLREQGWDVVRRQNGQEHA